MPWWPGHRPQRGRRAAILVPSLFRADATGNDALAMREALAAEGWDARLFAEASDPSLGAQDVEAARRFLGRDGAVAIFHQSTRWDRGLQLLRGARGPIVVRDHNVTPAGFFAGLSEEFTRASIVGAQQRERLACDRSVALFLAASRVNQAELVALGADPARVAVVAPLHGAQALADLAPDEPALRRWTGGPPTALFVGRLAPNKGHRRMLRVAAAYRELFGETLRLRLVGHRDPRWSRWMNVLDRDRRRLGIDTSVELLGTLNDAELKAAYLTAHLFLCCSEHEGFCVPLIEASILGVPVVATHLPAVAETLGDSGLVLRDASDDLLAVAVRRVLTDGALRAQLVAAQRRNALARFSLTSLRRAVVEAVEPLAATGTA